MRDFQSPPSYGLYRVSNLEFLYSNFDTCLFSVNNISGPNFNKNVELF